MMILFLFCLEGEEMRKNKRIKGRKGQRGLRCEVHEQEYKIYRGGR